MASDLCSAQGVAIGTLRMSVQQLYETNNAHVAAFLVYAGLVLLEVKLAGPKSLVFVFQDDDDCEKSAAALEADFWNDRQVASPKALLSAYGEIRSELYKVRKDLAV